MQIAKVKRSKPYNCAATGMYNPCTKKAVRDKWIKDHSLFLGVTERLGIKTNRVVTPVVAFMRPLRINLMDAVTGTLYDVRTGRSLSSDQQTLVDARANKTCAAILKELRTSDDIGDA